MLGQGHSFRRKTARFWDLWTLLPKIEVSSTCDLHPFSCIHNYSLLMTEAICRCRLLYWIVVGFRHLFISPQVDRSMSELETVI